jgi:collagenase-like PrtC family protease
MELVVHIHNPESLAIALDQGVGGVAACLPRHPDSRVWSQLTDWRNAARQRGLSFYLAWDWLIQEAELPGMAAILAAVARLDPDGLQLRDLGLVREARRRHPHLPLQAAGNWGAHNTPGVRLAQSLGFTRVVLDGPISLMDLALVRRQTSMPLAVTLLSFCQGYAGLCLLNEYLGISCAACCLSRPTDLAPGALLTDLETFSGLGQLGLASVQIRGDLFSAASLAQVIRLFQSVAAASPVERPRVLAAAREVLEAFAEQLVESPPPLMKTPPGPPVQPRSPSRRGAAPSSRPEFPGRGRLWLEVRDYPEALALSREWREPLLLSLTPDNYAAFLKDHRRWGPRRLIWRLPPAIPESALAFYQKALETLGQGGYNRFVAGDWGAVALVAAAGGRVYGDQTLGVRNSWALKAARQFQVARVCLPPGSRPEHWQDFLKMAPSGSFWGYLYRSAPLAICPKAAAVLPPPPDLRWDLDADQAHLCLQPPQNLRPLANWLKQQAIFPLVVALPHSPLPRGQLPSWLSPRPPGRPRR